MFPDSMMELYRDSMALDELLDAYLIDHSDLIDGRDLTDDLLDSIVSRAYSEKNMYHVYDCENSNTDYKDNAHLIDATNVTFSIDNADQSASNIRLRAHRVSVINHGDFQDLVDYLAMNVEGMRNGNSLTDLVDLGKDLTDLTSVRPHRSLTDLRNDSEDLANNGREAEPKKRVRLMVSVEGKAISCNQ